MQDAEEGLKAALSSASGKDKEVKQMERQLQQHRLLLVLYHKHPCSDISPSATYALDRSLSWGLPTCAAVLYRAWMHA